jgi:hypothetical protein
MINKASPSFHTLLYVEFIIEVDQNILCRKVISMAD